MANLDDSNPVEFKSFSQLTRLEMSEAFRVYSDSFLPVETKRVETVLTMLKEDPNYKMLVARRNTKVIGFSLMYIFGELKVALLDYMAVVPSEQRRGLGQAIFKYTFSSFRQAIRDPLGLLLEVQKEEYAKDSEERMLRERRIAFYKRLGAKLLYDQYLLPPQVGLEPEVTYLLIVPCNNINHVSRDFLLQIIRAIHLNVYGYSRDDLITRIALNLPTKLRLLDITRVT